MLLPGVIPYIPIVHQHLLAEHNVASRNDLNAQPSAKWVLGQLLQASFASASDVGSHPFDQCITTFFITILGLLSTMIDQNCDHGHKSIVISRCHKAANKIPADGSFLSWCEDREQVV
jgi:hypothetical protein